MIKKITFNNFKSFSNNSFDLSNITNISGKNGSGKSSFRDAVVFALYNKTSEGGINTDKYIKDGETIAIVTLDYNGDTVERKRTSSKSELKLNGETVSQEKLEESLNLPEFKIFNSIFNPEYFNALEEKEKRDIVIDLTVDVDMMKLFEKLGGNQSLLEEYKIDLDDVEGSYKKINKQLKETKANIDSTTTEINLLKSQLDEKDVLDESEIDKKIADKEALKEKIDSINSEIEKNRETNSKIEKANSQKTLKSELQELDKKVTEDQSDTLKTLKEQYDELQVELVKLPEDDNCPVCSQSISNDLRNNIAMKNEQVKEQINVLKTKINEIEGQIADQNKIKSEIEAKEKMIDSSLDEFMDVNPVNISTLEDEVKELDEQRVTLQMNIGIFENEKKEIVKIKDSITEKEKMVSDFSRASGQLEVLSKILSPSGIIKEMAQMKKIDFESRISDDEVSVEITEILKSGMGFKNVFKIYKSGIESKFLSTGEQKKLGIKISSVLNELIGKKVPTLFFDNSESVSVSVEDLGNDFGSFEQVIVSRVEDKELELS